MPSTTRKKKRIGPLRYVDYGRCSSDDQKYGDFTTIDNQRSRNAAYIRARGGVHVGSYADEGKTGTNLERNGFKRLLAAAQAGEFDVVTITYMSRLARGPAYHAAEYMLKMAGVEVHTVEEDFPDDINGQINKEITIFADGLQPKQAALHTRTKMKGMFDLGYVCGHVPFGYRKEFVAGATPLKESVDKLPPQIMVPHEDETPMVRQAFAMAQQRCTRAEIRNYLRLVSGKDWRTDQVTKLLKDENYIGICQFGEWRNENHHEGIVKRDVSVEVQTLLRCRRY